MVANAGDSPRIFDGRDLERTHFSLEAQSAARG